MSSRHRSRKCFVPGCKTGNKNERNSLFGPPKDEEMLKKWRLLIRRKDRELNSTSAVCELHFKDEFIIRDYIHTVNGDTVIIPRTRPILAHNAMPTIFPGRATETLPDMKHWIMPVPKVSPKLQEINAQVEQYLNTVPVKPEFTLDSLINIKLPSKIWAQQIPSNDKKCVMFHVLSKHSDLLTSVSAEKLIIVTENESCLKCDVYIQGEKVSTFPNIESREMLEKLIFEIHNCGICKGSGSTDDFSDIHCLPKFAIIRENRIYSLKCTKKVVNGRTNVCAYCQYINRSFMRKRQRLIQKWQI